MGLQPNIKKKRSF
jgi:hypothetical protein